jgi:prepilin peptidase CpaA
MGAPIAQDIPFIVLLCCLLLASAVIDFWKLKVPNWLTFPMILSGWGYGALVSFDAVDTIYPDGSMGGHFGASLALTGIGLALLLPVYAIGGMGAGDVKMQMGYGAWIGAHYGWEVGWPYVVYGFCVAVIVGGVIAACMIMWRGDFRQNRANLAAIMHDLMNPTKAADAAAKRKPRMHLLPYGVPLCIGYITYILVPFKLL